MQASVQASLKRYGQARWLAGCIVAVLMLALLNSTAAASSYLIGGATQLGPILFTPALGGGVHPYSGPHLLPNAISTDAILNDANLPRASLRFADLSRANLSGANLSNADGRDMLLADADLSRADLSSSILRGIVLTGTNLSNANLRDANLNSAILFSANLRFADLSGANCLGASFEGADLSFAFLSCSGSAFYNTLTDFTGALAGIVPFDPVAAGWTLVPEPDAELLRISALLGLAWLRRRRV